MKFLDTYRFSPVAMGLDKPHADDLFHFDVSEIPVKKEERAKFIEENHIIIDKQWWAKQYQRCMHGYTVENAIIEGGDAIEDNKDAFWKGNNCFIPQYDLFLIDRKVHISGFYYFFLNFWKIYGIDADKKEGTKNRKTIVRPRFLDYQFLLTRRLEMAEEQSKDMNETKTRQLGYSELLAGLISYYYSFYKSSLNIIVGGTQTDADHTFENCDRGLEQLLNTQFYLERARGGDNKSLIKSKHTKSEIRSLTAKDNEQALSRYCFGKDTKVRMFNGSIKNIQDIKIGDKIMGVDSTVRNVLETHSGTDQMYKIYSEKTDSFTCNSNHLLYCYHKPVARKNNISKYSRWVCNNFNNKKTIKVDDTHFLIRAEDYYNTSPTFKRNTFIEKNKSIEYKKNKLLIDPYFIGLWLGDGEKGSLRFTVNSEEKEILEYLEYFAFSHCCSVKIEKARYFDFLGRDSKANRVAISYRDRLGKSHKPMRNYLLDEMRGIGIFNDKFIPKKYLYSSINDRLLLLAGLIDTDGWRVKTKYGFEHYAIAQVDRKLVYQIKELVESLGFYVNVSKPRDNGSINGYKGQPIYEIYISGVGIHNIPVRLKKKKIKEYKYKFNPLRARMDIDKVGIDEFYGITIDGDELFLLEDYTIVHNSPTLIVYEEIGKGKRDWSINVANFVTPSIYTNTSKTGLQIFLGTAGNMEEGAADLEKRHYNPEKYNILSFKNVYEPEGENVGEKRVGHFTSKWWYKVIDKDGNTKKKEGIDLLLEERKNIETSNLYIHITQNAIYASEAFQISTLGYFGDHKISMLNKRRIEIKQNKAFQLEKRGNLIVKDKTKPITYDNLEFEYCPNGWLNIIEEPIREKNGKAYVNLYIAGVDTYNTDESFYSDSKGAMYVKKRFLPEDPLMNTYVAELVERPDANEGGLELFYEHTMLVATWYNSKVNIEYVDKRIFDYYTSNGFEHLLYQRPRLAFANKIARSVLNNPYGTDKTLKPHGLSLLSDRLSDEYIGNMFFMRQIDALSKFKYSKKYNCDITIATMECEIASSEDEMLEVRIQDEMGTRIKRRKWKRINGRIIEIYV